MRLAAVTFLASLSVLALGSLGGILHPLDSLSHFRAHLGIVALLLSLVLLAGRRRLLGIAGLAASIAALATVAPAYVPQARVPVRDQPTYRLLHINLFDENESLDRVLALIRRENADIVSVNEITDQWAPFIESTVEQYPFRIICPRGALPDTVGVLSRHPFVESAGLPRCSERGEFAVASIDLDGKALQVGSVHLLWPWPFDQWRQVGIIAGELGQMRAPALLAGDLNATTWSSVARRIADLTGLILVGGYGSTWIFNDLPRTLVPFGLPIDQIMARDVAIHDARTLEPVGSDHMPVLLTFSLSH